MECTRACLKNANALTVVAAVVGNNISRVELRPFFLLCRHHTYLLCARGGYNIHTVARRVDGVGSEE